MLAAPIAVARCHVPTLEASFLALVSLLYVQRRPPWAYCMKCFVQMLFCPPKLCQNQYLPVLIPSVPKAQAAFVHMSPNKRNLSQKKELVGNFTRRLLFRLGYAANTGRARGALAPPFGNASGIRVIDRSWWVKFPPDPHPNPTFSCPGTKIFQKFQP